MRCCYTAAGAGVDDSLGENRKRVMSAGGQNDSVLIQAMAILINPIVIRPRRDLTAKKVFVMCIINPLTKLV